MTYRHEVLDMAKTVNEADNRREQILQAATRAIIKQGVDGTKLRDVSQEANVSVGMIQHYFRSRDELFNQATRYASEQLIRGFDLDEAKISDPWERVLALIKRWSAIEDVTSHSQIWLEFANSARKHPSIRPLFSKIYASWYDYVHRAVTDGVARGTLTPTMSINDAVSVFMSFFDGYEFDIANQLTDTTAEAMNRRAVGLARALFEPISDSY